MVGHAAAAVGLAHLDALHRGTSPRPSAGRRARCACPSCRRAGARARAGGRGSRPPGAAREALLQRDSVPRTGPCRAARPRVQPRDEGYSAVRGSRRALLARPLRWRLRGAWMWPAFIAITLLDGADPVASCRRSARASTSIPAILIATFGNLFLIGAVAPWLARRIWKRRPAAEPGAPPRAQLEVLTDRIGTGLLLATVVGVIAAGLAAKPLVVVGDRGAGARRGGAVPPRGAPERQSCSATSRRPTRGDSPTATSAPASRTTTGTAGRASSWTSAGPGRRVIQDPSAIPNPPR